MAVCRAVLGLSDLWAPGRTGLNPFGSARLTGCFEPRIANLNGRPYVTVVDGQIECIEIGHHRTRGKYPERDVCRIIRDCTFEDVVAPVHLPDRPVLHVVEKANSLSPAVHAKPQSGPTRRVHSRHTRTSAQPDALSSKSGRRHVLHQRHELISTL